MVLALESAGWVFAFLFCLALGLVAWLVLFSGLRSGQFRDSDDVADEMLENERRERAEPAPRSDGR